MNRLHVSLAILIVVAIPNLFLNASEGVSAVVETTAVSSYLWRGWIVNNSPSLQPAVTINWKSFSFSSWHSFSSRVPNHQAWTEHDLSVSYVPGYKRWTFPMSFACFMFPDKRKTEGNRTMEASIGVTYAHWLEPSFTLYHDFQLGQGNYYYASLSHTFNLRKNLDLSGQVGVGLNQHQYQPITTISNFDAVVTLGYSLTQRIRISPSFTQMTGNRSLFGSHRIYTLKFSLRSSTGTE